MKFQKIILSSLCLFINQSIVNAMFKGTTSSLARHRALPSIIRPISSLAVPSSPTRVTEVGKPYTDSSFVPYEPSSLTSFSNYEQIPPIKLEQYKAAFKEALQYARTLAKTPIDTQSPLKFQRPIAFEKTSMDSKAFLDLQLVTILKNKTIGSTAFLQSMVALAALYGFYKVVDFLNNFYENNTILMWAVEENNERIVEYLLNLGADIHKQNSDGDTAMIIAAKFGNAKIVELLINKVNEKYANEPENAKKEIAQLLNTKNKDGRTALLEVVEFGNFLGGEEFADPTEKGRITIIKILIENGANIEAQDKNGDNVLFLLANKLNAVSNDKESGILRELFDILAEEQPGALQAVNKYGDNLLLQAVKDNNLYLFNYLKDKVIDVMQPDVSGQNIIFKAVRSKNINMVKAIFELLEEKWGVDSKGAMNPSVSRSSDQRSYSNSEKINKRLAQSKLKEYLDIKDKRGATVLDYALRNKQLGFPLIELLVEKGAQPTQSQLSFAIENNQIDLVDLFLKSSKISPSMNDLVRALRTQNVNLLKTLLNNRHLSVEVKNHFIKNALLHSVQKQNIQLFELLFPMADVGMKESLSKDIVLTGNPVMINDFLNSSQVTEEMRRTMLKNAVLDSKSAETIEILLKNSYDQKAYQDPVLRSLLLRDAVKNVKTGEVKGVFAQNDQITKDDLMRDPVLKALLTAWEPKYEKGWGSWVSDKWSQWRGERGSKDAFEDKKRAFDNDIKIILFDENQDRQSKSKLSEVATKDSNSRWGKIFNAANNI